MIGVVIFLVLIAAAAFAVYHFYGHAAAKALEHAVNNCSCNDTHHVNVPRAIPHHPHHPHYPHHGSFPWGIPLHHKRHGKFPSHPTGYSTYQHNAWH